MDTYIEQENTSAVNTAIAAGAAEQVLTNPQRVIQWNSLMVTNRDSVDVRILLDGQIGGVNSTGRTFDIPANSLFTILPEENIFFRSVSQVNLDGATAETAGAIRFRAAWATKEP